MSFNYCIGFNTKKYTSLSKDQFYNKINANKEIKECLCEVLIDNEQYVHPYFDIDQKNTSIEIDFGKIIEKIVKDFQVEANQIAVSSDSRPGKTSYHLVLFDMKIKRSELKKYITKNKKILETLHFDIKPYASGMQKWKTLYSPKVTGKTEDEGCIGMVPPLEHVIDVFETAFENKKEEEKKKKK